MLFSMEASPLTTDSGLYSKKSMFTIKIDISHHSSPRSPGMLRKTGISPYIVRFWAYMGGFHPKTMVMGWYG
jgi:hypothetical protein